MPICRRASYLVYLTSLKIFQALMLGQKLCNLTRRMIDYGAVYASKTWRASDGRRLWLGWVYETSPGCYQTCAMGSPFVDSMVSVKFIAPLSVFCNQVTKTEA